MYYLLHQENEKARILSQSTKVSRLQKLSAKCRNTLVVNRRVLTRLYQPTEGGLARVWPS